MPGDRIADDVVRIALDKVEGLPFERFANAFYSSLVGASFVPLGGVRHGGADARDGTIFEDGSRADTFYQASVEEDAEGKIRRTVQRLRQFGRDPRNLVYLTSRTVKYSDRVERALGDELDARSPFATAITSRCTSTTTRGRRQPSMNTCGTTPTS